MRILLAYGQRQFSKKLKERLEKEGHAVSILEKGRPPRAAYDAVVQLGRDPADLAEGTRDLLEKVVKDKARFFLVLFRTDERLYEEASGFAKSLTLEWEQKKNVPTTVLNLARLYGPGIENKDAGAVGHLIKEFQEEEYLTLYGRGEDTDYYLYIDDAIEGVARAIEEARRSETYSVSPSSPTSSEAAARLLTEIGGGRHDLRFHRGLTSVESKGKVEGKPLPKFEPKTSFEEGVLSILKTQGAPQAKKSADLPHLRAPLIKWRPRLHLRAPKKRELVTGALVLIVVAPLIYLGTETTLALWQLKKTKDALLSFDFAQAQTAARRSMEGFERLGKFIPQARAGRYAAEAAYEISLEADTLEAAIENLRRSYRGGEVSPQSEGDFRSFAVSLESARQKLAVSLLEVKSSPLPSLPQGNAAIKEVEELIETATEALDIAIPFAKEAPDFLGYKGQRNYLILFQNSTELRSQGGFVGSLAVLSLKDGGIENLEFFDSYEFDSGPKALSHPAVARFLEVSSVPLREANFTPSFPQAARDISAIFEEAHGATLDGVLGATLTFAKDLVGATGELEVAGFERTITADNLFEVTTQEVELDFFPGSTKKKRFMQGLGEALIGKLFSLETKNLSSVVAVAEEALEEKNLLLYFKNAQLAQAVWEAGFDGHIPQNEGDFLLVLDNTSSGKVNEVWVERGVSYRVFAPDKEQDIRGEVTVTWEHKGTDAWPSKSYDNLLMVLVPSGTRFLAARLNGEYYYNTFVFEQDGKTGFAAYFEVPNQSTTEFIFTYELPFGHPQDITSYSLTVGKQPGTSGDQFSFAFEEPIGKEAVSEDLSRDGGRLVFEGTLERDLTFDIEVGQR